MARRLVRMVRDTAMGAPSDGAPSTRRWDSSADRSSIPVLYGRSFGHDPWPADWDRFDEFDPEGVFIAEVDGQPVGFCICFPRRGEGYISVVAVLPSFRRRGAASALVRRAVGHLAAGGADLVRIDAYADADAAVGAYRSLGFEVYEEIEDPEADQRGIAEE